MLKKILSNPKRLFVCVSLIVLYGIYSGYKLPISMYPATSKPSVNLWVPYGTYSAKKFRADFGSQIEAQLEKISNNQTKIDEIDAYYREESAFYEIEFAWGTAYDMALKEVELVAASISSQLPREIADMMGVWQRNSNSGFFAASLYSSEIGIRKLYSIIHPILKPELDKIKDAENARIWNPEKYSLNIKLLPEKLAQYNIFPKTIRAQIRAALDSFSGSNIKIGAKGQRFQIQSSIENLEELKRMNIVINDKIFIQLSDLAIINYGKDLHRERSFKTNGLNSLILFANPKSGANIKTMSEDIMKVLRDKKHLLPKSLKTKLIVDPSEAIKSSVLSLSKDVLVATLMAVLVLYLFIGGFKNIATAAIEIPLSMVISFIAMGMIDMNLNLISLGGLALAAGMNVDASVVVLENIFKHKEVWNKLNKPLDRFQQRLQLVYEAVSEVALPVILSISTTLIVFIPMAFTSDLTNAVLGDLARAVIFSHAISGLVALVIVPAVRVVILNSQKEQKAPLDKPFTKFEQHYENLLTVLIKKRFKKFFAICIPFTLLGITGFTIFPHLPKEVIGKPGSDWIYMYVNAYDTQSARHMDNILQEVEKKALATLDPKQVDYTWLEMHNRNGGQIMFKMLQRKNLDAAKLKLKELFTNTANRNYYISTWNPAQLPLPEEKHFLVTITGSGEELYQTASRLKAFLNEDGTYQRIKVNPANNSQYSYTFKPDPIRWNILQRAGSDLSLSDIADISQLSQEPSKLGDLEVNNEQVSIEMSLRDERYTQIKFLENYPLKIQNKVIPLKALGQFESVKTISSTHVRDGQEQVTLSAFLDDENNNWEVLAKKMANKIKNNLDTIITSDQVSLEIQYPQKELKSSLNQLAQSLILSIGLIFFLLWMQFQSVKQVSIIMMTIPLGISGVLIALYVFNSYLSLNSALGIILLNGITVNNSILLTEVTNELRKKGLRGLDLILSATKKRLRPILITSLTTILGMFPVALGLGDGGKILQPLGIAVCFGLIFATGMTLFVVPILLYQKEKSLNITENIGQPLILNEQDTTAQSEYLS
ncbi:MAG: efflux RND transporter permease subunit [Bacteriovoracaceae bacterium]|jgi:multidrug efflux pump subunit AcrB|nr:efflux RND transporter permease subunit [Bacteriovoracaceae bacterium]